MKKIFSVILSSLTILTCLSGCGNSLKNVIFNNTVVTYDGKMHSIEASNLPSGVSVRYENNSFKDAGEYLVKVIFTKENKDLKTKEVKLTINPRNVTVNIDDKQSMIDDIEELTYTVEGLIEGDDLGVSLSVDSSSSGKKQIAETAYFTVVTDMLKNSCRGGQNGRKRTHAENGGKNKRASGDGEEKEKCAGISGNR